MRLKASEKDINWDDIPDEYNWVAFDGSGGCFGYSTEPYMTYSGWHCRGPAGTCFGHLPKLTALSRIGGSDAVFERPMQKVAKMASFCIKWGVSKGIIDGSITVDGKLYSARAEKVASGNKWIAYVYPACGVGYEPAYGGDPHEAFAVLTKHFTEAMEQYNKGSNTLDLQKLYDWFCDDGEQPSVEMCIRRLEEMRRAEIVLRGFIHDYEKNHTFLNQDQFPDTVE